MRSRPEPNSRMQARPPGVRTLSISRKASSLGRMLRMPKAMVMLSTEQSGRGSFLASAVTVVMRFSPRAAIFCLPWTSMGWQKSIARTSKPG